jgi:hypothetical protein
MTNCQLSKLFDKNSESLKNCIHTIEHRTTPIRNVDDIIAFIDRCGPRRLEK